VAGDAGTGAPVVNRTSGTLNSSRTRQAPALLFLLAALAAALLVLATSASADPSIADKQAQARAVLAEIDEMDMALGRAVEAYNGATVELQRIDGELRTNERHLGIAKSSLRTGQRRIAARLEELYVNGGTGGVVEIVLGARTLDDLLNRIDVVERVGAQDAKVIAEVKRFKHDVEERKVALKKARARQAEVVAQRAAQRRSIEGQIAERQRLYASIKDEIARLQAEERRRQAAAAAAARARLAQAREAAQLAAQSYQTNAAGTPDATAAPAEPTYTAPPPDGSRASQVVAIAMQYLGVPYVWGGMGPSGFDCSGLIAYAYAQIGVSLPHHAAAQYGYGAPVSRDALAPGDLVFFNGLGHAGIYVGGGSFIHAPHTGDVVKISSLYDGWYASTWVGGRRIL
jgi:cell wall-associated NlpC family hydrolase